MVSLWADLDALEREHKLDFLREPDLGIRLGCLPLGRGCAASTRCSTETDLAAGDFVRWMKQLLDLTDQVADAAGDAALRKAAREASAALRRGVVAYSSVVRLSGRHPVSPREQRWPTLVQRRASMPAPLRSRRFSTLSRRRDPRRAGSSSSCCVTTCCQPFGQVIDAAGLLAKVAEDGAGLTRTTFDKVRTARYQALVLADLARLLDEDVAVLGRRADDAMHPGVDPARRARTAGHRVHRDDPGHRDADRHLPHAARGRPGLLVIRRTRSRLGADGGRRVAARGGQHGTPHGAGEPPAGHRPVLYDELSVGLGSLDVTLALANRLSSAMRSDTAARRPPARAKVGSATASYIGRSRRRDPGRSGRPSAHRPVLVRRREHDRGPRRDVRRRTHPGQQLLEVGGRGHPHLEDVGLVAGHRPAALDLGDAAQPLGGVVGLRGVDRPDRDERRERQPDLVVVDRGAVPGDQPALLQPLDPLVHRRGGQTGRLAEVGERHPPVGGQERQDAPVEVFHARHPSGPDGRARQRSRHARLARVTSRLMLLDTASMYFRAFYGVPDSVTAPDGTPVNAVRGLLDFISRLVSDYRPTHLACCWDNDWRPAVARRPDPVVQGAPRGVRRRRTAPDVEEVPDPLEAQVPVIRDVLAAFGIAVVGADGYEADDVIGTLATRRRHAGRRGDRRPRPVPARRRRRARCGSSTSPAASAGTSGSPTPWCGRSTASTARQYADFAALRGDPSDGLPGVTGIGEKTAATLLQRFGDIAGLRAAAAGPGRRTSRPSPRRKIVEAADYLEVAPDRRRGGPDIDLGSPDLTLPLTPVDPDGLVALSEQWNLESPIARLVETLTDLR